MNFKAIMQKKFVNKKIILKTFCIIRFNGLEK